MGGLFFSVRLTGVRMEGVCDLVIDFAEFERVEVVTGLCFDVDGEGP